MRYLYYCNSAYQLINVLNLHWQRLLNYENINDYSADLIMLNAYAGAEEIVNIIQKNNIFNDIKLIDRVKIKGKFHIIKTIKDIFMPSSFIKNGYGYDKKEFINKYDYIYTPKFNRIIAAIWQLNRNAKLHMYEDGLSTYFSDLGNSKFSKSYKIFYKLLNHGRDFDDVEIIYVNRKNLYCNCNVDKVKELPRIDDNVLSKLSDLFSEFVYKDNKEIYWLSQLIQGRKNNERINSLLDELVKYKEKVLYCPHPRNVIKNSNGFDESVKGQIWELKLVNEKNINDKCLISLYSTACLTPKILFDKEPYLILAYNLIDDEVIENKERFIEVINKFKQEYKEQEKVMIPLNFEEYKECLNKIA